MEKEIEVKVLNIDVGAIEERLKNLNAKLIGEEHQRNLVFDARNPLEKLNEDDYLRIREIKKPGGGQKSIELTFKENIGKDSLRQSLEQTVEISNSQTMIQILQALGYDLIEEGIKHRKSYLYQNIRFDLDSWDENTYPHPYLEIEVEKPKDLEKAIDLLNIDRGNISTKSILQLKKEL